MTQPWWHPERLAARLPALRLRGEIVAALRGWFAAQGFAEVETPILQVCPGMEPHLRVFSTELEDAFGQSRATRYLHTSPEFAMKKLLVAGMPRIFQLARVFRNGETSPTHHPEFTMLEAYEAYGDYATMMDTVESLIRHVAQTVLGTLVIEHKNAQGDVYKTIDLTHWRRVSYKDLVREKAGEDWFRVTPEERRRRAVEDLKLQGVKFGPIYNGVSLLDPRLEPVYQYLVRHNLPLTMHMGTTYGANAPIHYGRPLDVDTIANRHPDLKMVMAHMGHPWYEECIVVARKNPNVYCEVSALYYRPWQFWNILVCAQEYTIANRNKIFWGTDFPFTTVADSIAGLRNVNAVIAGSGLPRVTDDTIEQILHSDPTAHWWHGGLSS